VIKSTLSLEISDNPNTKIMRLFDTSHYYSDESVTNYLIEVLPVNKNYWLVFNVAKGFSLTLNSSNLLYKKVSEEAGLIDLPDGIYEIKQSIKPNIHTVVHYYHMRTTELVGKIQDKMVELLDEECKLSRAEYYENRDKLRNIEEYARSAKWMVEECNNKAKGKEIYEFANKLLEKYSNDCQC
jgi:hypothetical protein